MFQMLGKLKKISQNDLNDDNIVQKIAQSKEENDMAQLIVPYENEPQAKDLMK